MNFSNPILVCDENQEFRILLRDMLTKNGYFHVLEASNSDEAIEILQGKKDFFVLIQANAFTREVANAVLPQKNFIVLADSKNPQTPILSANYGLEHVMTYPFHSRKLIDKIKSLNQ